MIHIYMYTACREYGDEGVEADTHSTIRRQSVIIEGLTMETDELRVWLDSDQIKVLAKLT